MNTHVVLAEITDHTRIEDLPMDEAALDNNIKSKRAELAYLSGLLDGLKEKMTTRRALTPDFGPLAGVDQLLIEVRILFGFSLTDIRGPGRDSGLTAAKAYATWRMRNAGWKFKDIDKFFDRQLGTSSTYLYHYNQEWWERYIIRSYADEELIQRNFDAEVDRLLSVMETAGDGVSPEPGVEEPEASEPQGL